MTLPRLLASSPLATAEFTRAAKGSTSSRWISRALVVFCAAASVITPLAAQERFGSFLGTVTDPSGSVVSGANVTLTNKETHIVRSTKTDGSGAYVFRQIEPGRYAFTFEQAGFSKAEVADALLVAGQELTVNTALQVGANTQSVQVTDAAPLLDTTTVLRSNNINAEEFNQLPKGRSFQSIAQFAPSVNTGTLEGGFQINGASGAENQFFVDGVSVNSVIDGRSRENAAFEFLQEVQVKTSGIDAQYGGATGGIISAITRSGGNQFHGEAHYYLQTKAFSADPVKRLYLFDQLGHGNNPFFVQDRKQKNDLHEVGGSVGGYFIKDKVFFFSSVSPQLVRRSNFYLFGNGVDGDVINSNQTNQQLFNKLTLVPTSRLRVNLSWLWTPTRTTGVLPAYTGGVANSATASRASAQTNKTQGWTQPQSNYTGQVDYTLTPTTVISVRGGRFWDNFRTWGIPSFSSVTIQTAAPAGYPAELTSLKPGDVNTPRTQQTFYDITTRSYYQVDVSKYFGNFFGSHDLQIGEGLSKSVNRVNVSYPGGGYVFVYPGQKYAGASGQYGYYEVDNVGTFGTTGGKSTNVYIQDHWRIARRLSLSLGLRVEDEHIPSFRRGIREEAFSFGFTDKLSPRVGFSWDPKGDGRMKVYGSYARLFGNVPYETSRGAFGGDIWTIFYRALDTTNVYSLSGTNMPGANLFPTAAYKDNRLPNFDTVDPNIKPLSDDLISAGFEYQFSSSMVARANYTGNHLVRTIEDLGVINSAGSEEYFYANPGEGIASTFLSSGLTPNHFKTPRPKRNYDAVEFSLSRRFNRGFFGQASYVVSRLYGNYSGLANSDEIRTPTLGVSSATTQQSGGSVARPGSSASRAYDLDEVLYDAHGNLIEGRLATDRPQVFKLYGDYTKNWGTGHWGSTNFGFFFLAESGTPLSTTVGSINGIPLLVNGRGDLGRTPVLSQTDLNIGHEFRVAEGKHLRLEFNMLNLFNQKTIRHRFTEINRGASTSTRQPGSLDLTKVNLQVGYDYNAMLKALAAGGADVYDPRFGLGDLFNAPFSGRLGLKFTF